MAMLNLSSLFSYSPDKHFKEEAAIHITLHNCKFGKGLTLLISTISRYYNEHV
jgi:hypothetical protein